MGNSISKRDIEYIDGGSLMPHGVYAESTLDYDRRVVRKMMLERRIAPFYKGLAELDEIATSFPSDVGLAESFRTHRMSKKRSFDCTPRRRSCTSMSDRTRFMSQPDVSTLADASTMPTTGTATLGRNTLRKQALHHLQARNDDKKRRHGAPTFTHADLYRGAIECPICFLVGNKYIYIYLNIDCLILEYSIIHAISIILAVVNSLYVQNVFCKLNVKNQILHVRLLVHFVSSLTLV
jgi:hypothetical protein